MVDDMPVSKREVSTLVSTETEVSERILTEANAEAVGDVQMEPGETPAWSRDFTAVASISQAKARPRSNA